MAHRILRTTQAGRDLEDIGRYTLTRWGSRQMVNYLRELDKTIQRLTKHPEKLGQSRDNLKRGLRSLSHKQLHFIFYRVRGDDVEIIRVLHQRQNWVKYLG